MRPGWPACRALAAGGCNETVRQNENFFIGNQWEGVNAPDLDKPVINILKRVVSYFVSTLVSDDIGVNAEPFGGANTPEDKLFMKILPQQFESIF